MNIKEFKKLVKDGKIPPHHTSYFRGYVSRTEPIPEPEPYKGRFGEVFTVKRPNWDSSQYSFIDYYIFKEEV